MQLARRCGMALCCRRGNDVLPVAILDVDVLAALQEAGDGRRRKLRHYESKICSPIVV